MDKNPCEWTDEDHEKARMEIDATNAQIKESQLFRKDLQKWWKDRGY